MTTVQVNLLYTLVVALLVFFAGQMLIRRVAVLQRFSLSPPVVGGCLIAVMLVMADGFAHMPVSFDMSLKDSLLIAFFTTVGLAADARMLVKRIENSPSSSSSAAFSNAVSRGTI